MTYYNPAIFQPSTDVINRIVKAVASSPGYQTQGTPIVNTSTSSIVATIDIDKERRFVKCGAKVTIYEALCMEFVRSVTSIPIPKVYTVFQHSRWTYIVMEYIEAKTLDNAQFSMTPDQLIAVANSLRSFALQLRSVSSTQLNHSGYGAWPEGPHCNIYFKGKLPTKPFLNINEFHQYWLSRLSAEDREELRMEVPALSESTPALTHGDLSPRNILVEDGKIVAILDWETFGWYPKFWEYMAAYRGAWSRRWMDSLEQSFGRMPMTGGLFLTMIHSALTPQNA